MITSGDPNFDAAREVYLSAVNDPELPLSTDITSEADDGMSGVVTSEVGTTTALLVPDSETEGAGLPTRGRRMRAIRTPASFTPVQFKNAVIAAYHQYLMDGIVTADQISRNSGLSVNRAQELFATIEFRRACEIRGVVLGKTTGLTPEQDLCLQVVLDPYDGLSMSQKLKRAGVSNSKFQAWMKQPLFRNQVTRVSEQLLDNNAVGLVQLERLVGEGDLRAIQFKFEMNQRYNPRREQVIDILAVINKVMEALAKHEKNPQIIMAVANDMKAIAEEATGQPLGQVREIEA